jgi:hypothetical protein
VTEPRDEIDTWLEGEVPLLAPRPGALERIRRRARRRKVTQAAVVAAGCAVVVGVAAASPQIISALHGTGGAAPPLATGSARPSASPSRTGSPHSSPTPRSTSPAGQGTALSTTTSGTSPPPDFRPTSVTVVGTSTGFVGAVIGQAGPPCATQYCTSLAGTSSYGRTWYGVSAPYAGAPDGATGVSQLRFLNLDYGWAFGPSLWATTDGGRTWQQESTSGQRVTDLETADGSALAVFATCSGSGQDYASDCTSFSLWTSVAGSGTWTQVKVPSGVMNSSAPSSASLAIAGGTTAYLLTPSGAVVSGPVSGGSWSLAGNAPCSPGPALASGAPADAQLAAGKTLMIACADGSGESVVYTSAFGATWHRAGVMHYRGTATSLASTTGGQAVLATTAGLYYSAVGGASWQAAGFPGSAPAGGFSYVGMTSSSQGVAVPADAQLGEIFVTSDGGRTWTASPIKA